MKMKSGKCNLSIFENKFEHFWAKTGNDRIWENRIVTLLLGITLDNEFQFDEHVSNVCLKANRKLSALPKKMLRF